MKYIFEDKESDELSILFRSAYPSSVTSNFMYSNGNSLLVNKAKEALEIDDDLIFVFLDTVPSNKDINLAYKNLCDLSRENDLRVIVFPIVCAEYYFIKFVANYRHFILDDDTVRLCINKDFFFNSSLLQIDAESAKFARNFKRFCKVVLMNKTVLLSCFHKVDNHTKFFESDCLCDSSLIDCIDMPIKQKALNYVREFPCFPSGLFLNEHICNMKEIISIHRRLVDEFNSWVDRYKSIDRNSGRRYNNIKYLLKEDFYYGLQK